MLVGASAVPAAGSEPMIGLVDLDHLVTSARGMLGGRVVGEITDHTPKIEALERELRSIKEEYARERGRLDAEARARYEGEIVRRTEEIQRLHAETFREAQFKVRLRARDAIQADVEAMIRRYGRDRGFALIMSRRGGRVLYSADGSQETTAGEQIEITGNLLQMLPAELAAGRIGGGAGQ
jgi:hypothetical protein